MWKLTFFFQKLDLNQLLNRYLKFSVDFIALMHNYFLCLFQCTVDNIENLMLCIDMRANILSQLPCNYLVQNFGITVIL